MHSCLVGRSIHSTQAVGADLEIVHAQLQHHVWAKRTVQVGTLLFFKTLSLASQRSQSCSKHSITRATLNKVWNTRHCLNSFEDTSQIILSENQNSYATLHGYINLILRRFCILLLNIVSLFSACHVSAHPWKDELHPAFEVLITIT
jgi:hypothetical protein